MIEIKIQDVDISRLANAMAAAGKDLPHAIRRAVNHTGDKTRTQVVRALAAQTGAKYGVVRKALHITRANYSNLSYIIHGTGRHMSLKEFGMRTRTVRLGSLKTKRVQRYRVVSAAPWNKRRDFPGVFLGPGGHAYKRASDKRLPIEKLWGPSIPREMVRDMTREAFFSTVQSTLPARFEHELYRVLPK